MRILLTGIYGFIGSNLAVKLKSDGHEVVGIDGMTTSYEHPVHLARRDRIKSLGFQVIDLDLAENSSNLIIKRIREVSNNLKFDAIVHLAAWPGVLKSELFPEKYYRNNVVGFVNTLELIEILKPSKFLYASSSSVYGNLGSFGVCEEDADLPLALNFYAKSKQINEELAAMNPATYGTQLCGLRFFTVIGPWGRPDMSYWNFTERLIANQEILLRGELGGLRDFTDIGDLTGIITKVLETTEPLPKILNISNAQPKSARDLVQLLAEELHLSPQVKVTDRSGSEADITIGSKALLTRVIGEWEWTPIRSTMRSFVEWYRKTY
jgi:UDP-glucuronate 4-epimerase